MNDGITTVEARVKKVLAGYTKTPLEDIPSDAVFVDLGLDSLDGLEMMFDLEQEFDLEIPDEVAGEIKTLTQAVERIESLMSGDGEADPSAERPS